MLYGNLDYIGYSLSTQLFRQKIAKVCCVYCLTNVNKESTLRVLFTSGSCQLYENLLSVGFGTYILVKLSKHVRESLGDLRHIDYI